MKKRYQSYFQLNIMKEQAKDTGMAVVLICLIVILFWEKYQLVPIAVAFLVLDMVWPDAYRPAAKIWFGLSHLLGTIVSMLLLSILFFVLVTPVGMIRKLIGKDSLHLKKWKNNKESIFTIRNHTFSKKDIENPY